MVVEIIFNLFERCQQEERQMFGCYSNERVEVRYKTDECNPIRIWFLMRSKQICINPFEKT